MSLYDTDKCITCERTDNKGYASMLIDNHNVIAARYIYEKRTGEILGDKVLYRACTNRACINPRHMIVAGITETKEIKANLKLVRLAIEDTGYFVEGSGI